MAVQGCCSKLQNDHLRPPLLLPSPEKGGEASPEQQLLWCSFGKSVKSWAKTIIYTDSSHRELRVGGLGSRFRRCRIFRFNAGAASRFACRRVEFLSHYFENLDGEDAEFATSLGGPLVC
eukprot:XP_015581451.1 uncharacterized protein LOC107262130 [Ricinus communis]